MMPSHLHIVRNFMRVSCSALLTLAVASVLGGCDASATDAGDMGRLTFSLTSDYHMTSESLRDVKIVTGHPQYIDAQFVDGEDPLIDEMSESGESLAYAVSPNVDTMVEYSSVMVSNPGTYELSAAYDGDLVDKITLQFDRPVDLDLVLWVRCPDCEEFVALPTDSTATIEVGSQLSPVIVPLNAEGERLAGRLETVVTSDPPSAVIEGYNVYNAFEDGPSTGTTDPWFYFIESGTITLTFRDEVNGVSVAQAFEVTP